MYATPISTLCIARPLIQNNTWSLNVAHLSQWLILLFKQEGWTILCHPKGTLFHSSLWLFTVYQTVRFMSPSLILCSYWGCFWYNLCPEGDLASCSKCSLSLLSRCRIIWDPLHTFPFVMFNVLVFPHVSLLVFTPFALWSDHVPPWAHCVRVFDQAMDQRPWPGMQQVHRCSRSQCYRSTHLKMVGLLGISL